jgi:hypothetical protein
VDLREKVGPVHTGDCPPPWVRTNFYLLKTINNFAAREAIVEFFVVEETAACWITPFVLYRLKSDAAKPIPFVSVRSSKITKKPVHDCKRTTHRSI